MPSPLVDDNSCCCSVVVITPALSDPCEFELDGLVDFSNLFKTGGTAEDN